MRGKRIKLHFESPNKDIYKGDYAGVECPARPYWFDLLANKWINLDTDKPKLDFCGRQWTSSDNFGDKRSFKYEVEEYGYSIFPKEPPKNVRAFRRYLRKYSKYNLLPKGTKLILNSWGNNKDIYGFIK